MEHSCSIIQDVLQITPLPIVARALITTPGITIVASAKLAEGEIIAKGSYDGLLKTSKSFQKMALRS